MVSRSLQKIQITGLKKSLNLFLLIPRNQLDDPERRVFADEDSDRTLFSLIQPEDIPYAEKMIAQAYEWQEKMRLANVTETSDDV